MEPTGGGNGQERWRGETEARVTASERNISIIFDWKESHDLKHEKMVERLTSVETKVIVFAALAAAAGTLLPQILAAVAKAL